MTGKIFTLTIIVFFLFQNASAFSKYDKATADTQFVALANKYIAELLKTNPETRRIAPDK